MIEQQTARNEEIGVRGSRPMEPQAVRSEEIGVRGSRSMEQQTVTRSENKYLLNEVDAASLRQKLDRLLTRDVHSGGAGYRVRSLYFDTPDNLDFRTKMDGVEARKKIRLRVYSPRDEWCKLEAKKKVGDRQKKISLAITAADAKLLTGGDASVLLGYVDESDAAAYLYTEMTLGCMRPVTLVEYDRIAYIYPDFETRITFDSGVVCSESDFDLFRERPLYAPSVLDSTVLEVKYDRHLVKFISDVLKPYHLTRVSVSKYCLSRPLAYEFM